MRENSWANDIADYLSYNSETGAFHWKKRPGKSVHIGDAAGCPDKDGYLRIQFRRQGVKLHRIAWFIAYGCFPAHQIDHINGDPADNRLVNLREATARENCANRKIHRSGKLVGFSPKSIAGRIFYEARISVKGNQRSLGLHRTPEAAHHAYRAEADKIEKGDT